MKKLDKLRGETLLKIQFSKMKGIIIERMESPLVDYVVTVLKGKSYGFCIELTTTKNIENYKVPKKYKDFHNPFGATLLVVADVIEDNLYYTWISDSSVKPVRRITPMKLEKIFKDAKGFYEKKNL